MKDNTPNLHHILNKLFNSTLSRSETNFLIKKSYQISVAFLKSKFSSKLNFLSLEENSMEDLAMDAIVPLFVNNQEGILGISWALQKWNDPIERESDADYFLSRIIWRRVDQSVTKLFKERDPVFAKILKTLNFCVSNNSYAKVRYFGTVYILRTNSANNTIDGPVINEERFSRIPVDYFANKQSRLFETIFNFLETETEFFPAIPLNLLVQRVKSYHLANTKRFETVDFADAERFSLDNVIEEALCGVKEKLDVYYVKKNKMNDQEAEMIYASFNNISQDFLHGGMHGSLYSYLKDQNPSLTKETFYSKYNNRVSYLFSIFKNNLIENIST